MHNTKRTALPQLAQDAPLFLTDSGLETELIFHDGLDLPEFASFPLLLTNEGGNRLGRYFQTFADLSDRKNLGLVLETPTWRASANWAEALGIALEDVDRANRNAVDLLASVAAARRGDAPTVISGNIGPAGDGYDPERLLTVSEARDYHERQVAVFADTAAHMVSAFTMTHVEEATGIALAARDHDIHVAIAFTVETDGRLPTGQALGDAILETDKRSAGTVAYYMINCAHPDHFAPALAPDEAWIKRIIGFRANASRLSHAELDACETLDDGDPAEFGAQHAALAERFPHVRVFGGCCGTDHRHVCAMANRIVP